MLAPAALATVTVLFLLGVNPYFLPNTYDNLVYFFGAKSIAKTGAFQYAGLYVSDWGPGLPVMLAPLFWLGIGSVVAAKLVIVACAAASLALCYRLFVREQRPWPLVSTCLFGLVPTGYMMGTRILSEWPFIFLAFAFLWALGELNERRRGVAFALALGGLLGAAALTRWVGVVLGAAIVAQAWIHLRDDRTEGVVRRVLPEAIAAAIGGGVFVLWRLKLSMQIQAGTAASTYYKEGSSWFSQFDPTILPDTVSDLFFQTSSLNGFLDLADSPIRFVWYLVIVVMITGLVIHGRRNGFRPGDWYALATLAILMLYENKITRYALPIAPFLISYFLAGVDELAARIAERVRLRPRWLTGIVVAGWVTMSIAFDAYLLVRGNFGGAHAGIGFWAASSPEEFYKGHWLGLYRLSRLMAEDPQPGAFTVVGESGKYPSAFSGRKSTPYPTDAPLAFVLEVEPAKIDEVMAAELKLSEVARSNEVILYRVGNTDYTK